jgi:hypothetical protein
VATPDGPAMKLPSYATDMPHFTCVATHRERPTTTRLRRASSVCRKLGSTTSGAIDKLKRPVLSTRMHAHAYHIMYLGTGHRPRALQPAKSDCNICGHPRSSFSVCSFSAKALIWPRVPVVTLLVVHLTFRPTSPQPHLTSPHLPSAALGFETLTH